MKFSSNKPRTPRYIVVILIVSLSSLLVTTCGLMEASEDDGTEGIILLWHSWDEEQSLFLNRMIADFTEIHPNAKILITPVQPEQLQDRFEEAARSALGPDLILGQSEWIKPLAEANLIRPITGQVEDGFLARYLPAAVETVLYEEQLYGLPESLRSSILYYNTKRVKVPAKTLDELLLQAERGEARVAIGTRFTDAFWGIQAFGGHLFNDEDRVILDKGGFANWLAWLRTAQDLPSMVLDKDMLALSQLFVQNDLDYLVGNTSLLPELIAELGTETVGVMPLPAGPIRSAGPFLKTDAFLFSNASSQRQTRLAVAFAKFVTNAEQATILMRRAGRVPANVEVRVNPKVDGIAHSFVTQAKGAVPFRNTAHMDIVLQHGSDAYNKVLQGVLSSAETAQSATQMMNEANGFEALPLVEFQCTQTGTLLLWHSWQESQERLLGQILQRFKQDCPTIIVKVERFTEEDLFEKLSSSTDQGAGGQPDVVLIHSQWLNQLMTSELFHSLDPWVDDALLQRYNPAPIDAFRYQGRLLGLPATMELVSLYYNKQLVNDPVTTLDDLLVKAVEGKKVAIPTTFAHAFWGISAFGGTLFDETRQLALDRGGFTQWLDWLQIARNNPGIILDTDIETLQRLFVKGEVIYYVGGAEQLVELEARLGRENVGVITLPTGPEGEAKPLLTSQGFAIYQSISESQINLALEFIEYATNVESQTLLKERVRLVPANARVDIGQDSPIAQFIKQAQLSMAYPNIPQMIGVEAWGTQAYLLVLGEGDSQTISNTTISNTTVVNPAQVVDEITNLINQANGITLSQELTVTQSLSETQLLSEPVSEPVDEPLDEPASNKDE